MGKILGDFLSGSLDLGQSLEFFFFFFLLLFFFLSFIFFCCLLCVLSIHFSNYMGYS
jgi:hypothetical protein